MEEARKGLQKERGGGKTEFFHGKGGYTEAEQVWAKESRKGGATSVNLELGCQKGRRGGENLLMKERTGKKKKKKACKGHVPIPVAQRKKKRSVSARSRKKKEVNPHL